MKDYLPLLIIGLANGSVYALAAMGLVVTYTTSGIFNFAHGAIGMIVAYAFLSLRENAGLPTPVAVAVCVVFLAPVLGMLLDRLLFRRLAGAAPATRIVISIGLMVGLQGLAVATYGPANRRVAPLFPQSRAFSVGGAAIGFDHLILISLAALLGAGLVVLFRHTRYGLSARAVVNDRDLTDLTGTDSRAVTTLSWMIGCGLAGLAGILIAPLIGLDAVLLTLLVLQAVGAAVVGGLQSLPVAYVSALAIGVLAALSTKWAATYPVLQGLPSSLPFIVLFVVLISSRTGRFLEVVETRSGSTTQFAPGAERPFPLGLLVVGALGAATLAGVLSDTGLVTATATLTFVLVFDSLGLVVGQGRLVSLCHAAFVVFGATTFSHLLSAGLPQPIALLLAALVIAPAGALLAVPALRLPGLFFAIATFGFGVLAQYFLFPTALAFGRDAIVHVRRPALFTSEQGYFVFVMLAVVSGVAVIELLRAGRIGRLLAALADSPPAVESIGVNPTASRIIVFGTSAFFAALAGGLLASITLVANPNSFTFGDSLLWVTVLVAAGPSSLAGAMLAAFLLNQLPMLLTASWFVNWMPVWFGVSAILLAQIPDGLVGLLRVDWAAVAARSAHRRGRSRHAARRAGTRPIEPRPAEVAG